MSINWNRRNYTKQEFIDAWCSSVSIAEVAKKLGRNKNGSGYYSLKAAAKELGLDTTHMTGQSWSKGKKLGPTGRAIPLADILVENSDYSRKSLKARLIEDGILTEECAICGLTEWLGEPAPLDLDHINGINNDNRIENLRLLCANCHRQTITHGGKQLKGRKSDRVFRASICPQCGGTKKTVSILCKACESESRLGKNTKTVYPPLPDLIAMLKQSNFTQVSKELGVSDNAVRKHISKRGYDPKTLKVRKS